MKIDKFGRNIIENENGTYSVENITIKADNFESALFSFNAMAPEIIKDLKLDAKSLDSIGALATLLAVKEILTLKDAANALKLNPEDLIFEAKAWEAAKNLFNPLG